MHMSSEKNYIDLPGVRALAQGLLRTKTLAELRLGATGPRSDRRQPHRGGRNARARSGTAAEPDSESLRSESEPLLTEDSNDLKTDGGKVLAETLRAGSKLEELNLCMDWS